MHKGRTFSITPHCATLLKSLDYYLKVEYLKMDNQYFGES